MAGHAPAKKSSPKPSSSSHGGGENAALAASMGVVGVGALASKVGIFATLTVGVAMAVKGLLGV